MSGKSAQALWQDYRFLTQEMRKFLIRQDMDLFYELLKQRERLQAVIDQTADEGFKVSPAGQNMLGEIQQTNKEITHNFQLRFKRCRQQRQVSEAYSNTGTGQFSRMSWQR